MQTHGLKRPKGNIQKAATVGRGGKRGKTSGRGTKGQKAHGGHGMRPEMRDFIKKFPKLRGHGTNRSRTVNADKAPIATVNLAALEASSIKTGEAVTPKTLVEAGVIALRGGKTPAVKILAQGTLTKKLTIEGCAASATARSAVEAVGGSIK